MITNTFQHLHAMSKFAINAVSYQWFKGAILSGMLRFYSTSKEQSDGRNQQNAKKQVKQGSNVLSVRNPFLYAQQKSKENYLDMVTIFEERDIHRRNHVEFIYAALKSMADYGVDRDLDVYKALLNIMPKGKFIPTNLFQAEFMHYPKQQQCIIDLLEQMEDLGVMPDYEMEAMLLNVFGRRGHPLRKYWRMMYWMPKFRNLSPWTLPNPMPDDTLQIAKLAVERMCSVDLCSQVEVYETKLVNSALDETWIVSGMSPEQTLLLRNHPLSNALFIEGPFLIWLRNRSINYFTLRSDPDMELFKSFQTNNDGNHNYFFKKVAGFIYFYVIADVSRLEIPLFGKSSKANSIGKYRSVHQQEDGTIFAICVTGTSTKDSLLSWVRLLEKDNPILGKIPIVFRSKSNVYEKKVSISASFSNETKLQYKT